MKNLKYKSLLVKIPPSDIAQKYPIALKAVNQAEVVNPIDGYQRPVIVFNKPPGIMADIGGISFRVFWMKNGHDTPDFKGQFDQDIEVVTMDELRCKNGLETEIDLSFIAEAKQLLDERGDR